MEAMTGNMLRRKSLSLEKAPGERIGRRERRSSVAAGVLPLPSERRSSLVQRWLRHISDAADAYKNRSGRSGRTDSGLTDHSDSIVNDSTDSTKEHEDSNERNKEDLDTSGVSQVSTDSSRSQQSSPPTQTTNNKPPNQHPQKPVEPSASQRKVNDPPRLTMVNPLINPSEVVVARWDVLQAEPVLTPLEKLRLQDLAISHALTEKQHIVADMLHFPRDEFLTIAEMAGEPGGEKEASELVLAAISQANQLTEALNESLRVTEEEAVSLTSGGDSGCSPRGRRRVRLPGLPAPKVQNIASALNSQLSQLLEMIKDREDERERLRRELQKSREKIHAMHEAHRKPSHVCNNCSQDTGTITGSVLAHESQEDPESINENDNNEGDKLPEKEANTDIDDAAIDPPDKVKPDTGPEVFVDVLTGDQTMAAETDVKEDEPSDAN